MPIVTLFDKPTRLTTFRAHNTSDEFLEVDLFSGDKLIARLPITPGGHASFYGASGLRLDASLIARHGGPEGSLEVSTITDDATTI